MADSGISVRGLPEFRAALKAMGPEWGPALTKTHKAIAAEGAAGAQGIAIGMGGVQAKAADRIRGKGTQQGAAIGPSGGNGIGNVAFWGAKKRAGWYAAGKYRSSTGRQFPLWVGNSWDTAAAEGGPYAINRALFFDLPKILELYQKMILELAKRAFPD